MNKNKTYMRISKALLNRIAKMRLLNKKKGRGYGKKESYANVIRRLIKSHRAEMQKDEGGADR